jgi:hypothetical protein
LSDKLAAELPSPATGIGPKVFVNSDAFGKPFHYPELAARIKAVLRRARADRSCQRGCRGPCAENDSIAVPVARGSVQAKTRPQPLDPEHLGSYQPLVKPPNEQLDRTPGTDSPRFGLEKCRLPPRAKTRQYFSLLRRGEKLYRYACPAQARIRPVDIVTESQHSLASQELSGATRFPLEPASAGGDRKLGQPVVSMTMPKETRLACRLTVARESTFQAANVDAGLA